MDFKKKPTKKSKKKNEDNRPGLIVCKRNGEYIVEMKVTDAVKNSDAPTQYDPMIYKIESERTKRSAMKRDRKRDYLIKKIHREAIKSCNRSDICKKRCLRAYKEAVGILNPNQPECNCSDSGDDSIQPCYYDADDSVSSDCSSLDIDWEIHFTPPIAAKNLDKENVTVNNE